MNENEFRNGVMPRAQLSMMASQLAVDKATQKNAKEFAVLRLPLKQTCTG
jgi:putative membrane protein